MRTSAGLISISIESSISGRRTAGERGVAPAELSNGELRTRRCTPVSVRSRPKAYSPSILMVVALLMPATSPGFRLPPWPLKPLRSAYLRYWRSSMLAQSQASVPPRRPGCPRKQFSGSAGLLNMRRNSSCSTSAAQLARLRPSMVARPVCRPLPCSSRTARVVGQLAGEPCRA